MKLYFCKDACKKLMEKLGLSSKTALWIYICSLDPILACCYSVFSDWMNKGIISTLKLTLLCTKTGFSIYYFITDRPDGSWNEKLVNWEQMPKDFQPIKTNLDSFWNDLKKFGPPGEHNRLMGYANRYLKRGDITFVHLLEEINLDPVHFHLDVYIMDKNCTLLGNLTLDQVETALEEKHLTEEKLAREHAEKLEKEKELEVAQAHLQDETEKNAQLIAWKNKSQQKELDNRKHIQDLEAAVTKQKKEIWDLKYRNKRKKL